MEFINFEVQPSFIANTLRNIGYNNYSAIADIIDNSVEPNVCSSYVKVDFETLGTGSTATIDKILIIDDGIGMDYQILRQAMSLGSQTGKNPFDNLGMYGAGLKTAAFSIGQKLEVFTKTENGNLEYAVVSLEEAIANNENISTGFYTYSSDSEEYNNFIQTVGCEHGTIVKISVLDRLTSKNYQTFKGTLKNKLSEIFNKFILANVVKFYVHKDEVPYTDLMGNIAGTELMGDGNFEVEGCEVSYKAWFLPKNGDVDSAIENDEHYKNNNGTEYTKRNSHNQGIYIYRQNRLVGKALTFGLWQKHPLKNGFRCEIFVDGNADALFGSTFTKMISEKSRDTIHQSLYDKLVKEISPYATEADRRDTKDLKMRKENNPELKKETEEFYRKVTDKQNKNMMLNANRKGISHVNEEKEEKEHQVRGPQKNPAKTREGNKWLHGFKEMPMGRTSEMYCMERRDNKRFILINTDHPYYQNYYSKLDNDMKFIQAQIISCGEAAKDQINYYGSGEIQSIIDNYESFLANEVNKSLTF